MSELTRVWVWVDNKPGRRLTGRDVDALAGQQVKVFTEAGWTGPLGSATVGVRVLTAGVRG